jgi:hypothetical protein
VIGTTASIGSEVLTISNSNNNTYNSIRLTSSTTIATGNIYHVGMYNNGASVGGIITNAASGVTAFNTSSDIRLKKNINYDFDGLSIIDQLKPACFTMISDTSDTVYHGFIAQDIAPIYPQYVTIPAEGIETGHYTMDYSQFTGIAVRAIKQQQVQLTSNQQEITALHAQITSLQIQNATLESRLASLEQRLATAGIA